MDTRYSFIRCIVFCTSVLLFGATGALVYGATLPSGSFIVKPAKAEVTLSPGESKTVLLTLINGTPSPLSIDTTFEDIVSSSQKNPTDDPVKLLGKEHSANSLKDLLSIPKESFDLLSSKEVQIPVTITVPNNVRPGGRYGSVVFTFKTMGSSVSGQNVTIESRLAVTLYVRIAGSVNEEGRLAAFGLFNDAKTSRSPTGENPLRFQVAFENQGDVHLNPYGRLSVSNVVGAPHSVIIDPWVVLPGATRMREIDIIESLSPGYYTAHLELNRGYQDIVDTKEVKFWVLPSAFVGFIWFCGFIFIIWLIRRSLQLSKHAVL